MLDSDKYTLADFVEYSDRDLFAKTRLFWDYAEDYKRKGYYNYCRRLLTPCQNRVTILDDLTGRPKEMVMMGSNNYLGLTTHPKVLKAGREAHEKYGAGAGGPALLSGSFEIHRELEERLARLKGCEDALVFSTGYSTNVGIISGLLRKNDVAIIDRLDHASIVDGCIMAGGDLMPFRHKDLNHLERVLLRCDKKYMGKLVVVDGVFSMDGDVCPLPEICNLAKKYNARVMVDDAHATGVLGKHGGGTTDHFDMQGEVDMVMGTFSKALASVGGFVASSREVINYLRHYSRAYVFSANLPPYVAATVLAGLNVIEEEPGLREGLWDNARYMHRGLRSIGYRVLDLESAIIIVIIGDEVKLRGMSKRIHELGVFLSSITYPAVPRGQCRFRIGMMATHTREDMDEALKVMEKVGKEFGVV